MREKIKEALNEISERHIAEAVGAEKKRSVILRIVAAAAMAAIVIGLLQLPKPINAKAVSLPAAPRITERPDLDNYENRQDWQTDWESWQAERTARADRVQAAATALSAFFTKGSEEFLSKTADTNAIWSPVNAYIGLAMLSEVTSGESRQQILELLDTQSTDMLRQQVSAVWESVYQNNGKEICTLANSLWVEEGLSYDQGTMDTLSHHYYASVYQGDLGSSKINQAIGAWLDNNTGGLLNAGNQIKLPTDTILALYSTLYFQAKWSEPFQAGQNTSETFHAPSGDRSVTYMNKELEEMYYYWGDYFSAVALRLKNGSTMWFVLPDEGITPAQVLSDGQYMQMLTNSDYENSKYMKVNLSIPKFDISAKQDLKSGLQNLGITAVFDPAESDFSAITTTRPVYLSSANQAARVQIDEEGVKAAAYIEFPGATSPMPPEEIIDFILDRPFLFAITKANIPLFAGVINEP